MIIHSLTHSPKDMTCVDVLELLIFGDYIEIALMILCHPTPPIVVEPSSSTDRIPERLP